jgi:hypothetical protein
MTYRHTLTCRFGVGLIRKDIPLPDVGDARAVLLPGSWDGEFAGSPEYTGFGTSRAFRQ